jgi:hypothetical protein
MFADVDLRVAPTTTSNAEHADQRNTREKSIFKSKVLRVLRNRRDLLSFRVMGRDSRVR